MNVKKIIKLSVLYTAMAVFAFAMSPSLSSAQTADWFVDTDISSSGTGDSWGEAFQTIPEAVGAANDGDEIWVKSGTYSDGTIYMTQNVFIYGGFVGSESDRSERDWVTNETIVDGGGTSQCFYIRYYDATIDGFTIRNGNASRGGGIYFQDNETIIHDTSIITNCIFNEDNATISGGAIVIRGSSPTITNCLFTGNHANGATSFGGAIMITDGAGGSAPNIINCTFSGNTATTAGDALANSSSTSSTITNCIFWGNGTQEINDVGTPLNITYSDIDQVGYAGSNGNISEDPDFVDGYKLDTASPSPCIDTGTDAGLTTDIEGKDRPMGSGHDMGAYEMGCAEDAQCDDSNPCTNDACNAGACENTNNTDPCDDGLFCSVNDTCSGGACISGDPMDCSAFTDQCNDGVCDEAGDACIAQPVANGTPCDDSLFCTDNDTCSVGVCISGDPMDCSAFTDQCNTGNCDEDNDTCVAQPIANGTPCDDTQFCTQTDQCTDGACTGDDNCPGQMCDEPNDRCVDCFEDADCDDSDPCTNEICDTGLNNGTCVYTNNTDPCDDGLFCTDNDTCSGGACISGDPMDCSAFTDQCNDGVCDEAGDACIAQPVTNGNPCNDSLFCTETDQCTDGTCVGSGDPCPVEQRCDEDLDECVNCIDDIDCDDSNDCTDDVCNAGSCEYTNNTDSCDDGLFCTTSDQCADGTCTGDETCPGQQCDEINEVCYDHILTVNIIGNGVVTLDPDPILPSDDKYDNGTDVELTAIPDPDNIFAGWAVDLTGFINPENITMDSDKTVTAKFVAYEIVENATDISLEAKDPSEFPDNATENLPDMLPYGLIEVEITGVPDNGTTAFKITLPAPAPPGFTWQKCTEATGCIDFSRDVISGGTGDGAVISDNRTEVTVYVTDNGPYDLDNTLGSVKDPSGLAGECILNSDCSVGFECNVAGTCVRSSSGGGGGGGGGGTTLPAPECVIHSDCENGYCDTENGGVCVECLADGNCDNGVFCDGLEKCVNTVCVAGTDPCSEDETCDEENNVCIPPVTTACEEDSDCDNNIFCDGIETCEDGVCADGEEPCDEDEVCMEGVDACWGIEKLTALSLQKSMFKPIILSSRCPWLAIKPEAPNNFSANSHVSITGPDEGAQGVVVDSARETSEFLGYILVPVCIDKNATEGEWTLQIESDVDDPSDPFMEVIEYSFEIR